MTFLACGDGGGGADDFDNGSDPGPQLGDLAMCGVEGPDSEASGECILSGGGAFRADFNSDANSDLAIGAPYADVDGVVDAGAVFIFYGGRDPMGRHFLAQTPQILTQNTPGSGDQAEPYDRFGWSVSAMDVSNRGKADLVVGVPYEDVGTLKDAGAFHLFVGHLSTGTLRPPGQVGHFPNLAPFWTQDSENVPDVAEAGDLFGFSIAWGQLRTDVERFFDLVIGAPGEDIDAVVDAGAVFYFPHSVNGITATGSLFLHQGLPGMNESPESGDQFGWSLAAAEVASDDLPRPTYLAVGVPGEDVGTIPDAGALHVMAPSPTGPTATGSQFWHQDSAGIAGGCENGDRFGQVLVPRELRNGIADLFVGVPYEDLVDASGQTVADAGMVHLIQSSGYGLTATNNRVFTQADSSGSPATEAIEAGDRFGAAIAGGRFRGASAAQDIIIAAPSEDIGGAINAGVVHYLRNNAGAFPAADATVIGIAQTTGQTAAGGDQFGFGISVWQFGLTGPSNLIVGVPGKDLTINGTYVSNAGAAYVYAGSASGLVSNAAVTLSIETAGRTPPSSDGFGRVMY